MESNNSKSNITDDSINNKQHTSSIKEYLKDSYLFKCQAKITSIEEDTKDNKLLNVTFDKTIFHPQGGGQPNDEGKITSLSNNKSIEVKGLVYNREVDEVYHQFLKEEFDILNLKVNDEILQEINEEKRRLYIKLHSAGHLLDIAVTKLNLNLVPGKGYHFPDGAYVEYLGKLDKDKIPSLTLELESVANELIEKTEDVNSSLVNVYDYNEGKNIFKELPKYLPENKPFRWVKLTEQDEGCPCGGTHVKHVSELNKLKISKIINKGKNVRISYSVN